MVTKLKGTESNKFNVGMHLWNPTKNQIEEAKEEARSKGFGAIYVHRTQKSIVRRK